MKELTKMELLEIQGGDIVGFIDGFCAAVDAGGVIAAAIGATIPVAGQVIIGGCAVWSLGRLFG